MRIINQETTTIPIDALRPHPRNPRQGDVGAIHESIEANGFYGAIVAQKSTGFILAGNHRWQAARAAGADEVPVAWVDVDDDHALRILLADNRTNDLAAYDDHALAELLKEIHEAHGNLIGTGYDGDDLDQLLADLGEAPEPGATPEAQPERADELQAMWQVKPGQLWSAGPHRIFCGDATDPGAYDALLAGQQAEMVWTDPPYGVSIGEKNRMLNARDRSARVETDLDNDSLDEGALAGMLEAAFEAALSHTAPGGAWYVAAPPGPLHVLFGLALKKHGVWRQTIQWVKNNATFSPQGVDYHWQAEPIFYGWKPGAAHRYHGGRKQTTVWNVDRPRASPEHPTMKPVELVARAVENSSRKGEIVLDPFAGSGTTLIAAHSLGRAGYGIELAPRYVAVILERLKDAGLTPELAND